MIVIAEHRMLGIAIVVLDERQTKHIVHDSTLASLQPQKGLALLHMPLAARLTSICETILSF